jgi:hypothetical protein
MPFHFNSSLLAPGSIILPGNWGRIVRLLGSQHQEWAREDILETIRVAEFPMLPSRFDCIFYFATATEAEFFRSSRGTTNPLILYEIELVDPTAPQHEADWKGTGPYDSLEWARRYWRGDFMPGRGIPPEASCRETLAVTPLRIVRKMP